MRVERKPVEGNPKERDGLGLDALARLVVHARPEAFIALLAACPEEGSVASRDSLRRLDAQSASDLRRPDVLYLAQMGERCELWVGELQARAPRWKANRATFAVDLAFRQTEELTRDRRWVVHPVEVRLLERAKEHVSSGNRGTDAAEWSGGGTLLGFNVCNRLVEPGPWCAVLEDPHAWPLRAVARYTPADEIAALMAELRSTPPSLKLTEVERIRLLSLLGLAGRVRFPDDRRFCQAEEVTMSSEAVTSAEPWGHLTDDEQLDLVKEARRRWNLSMETAHREGLEEGHEEGLAEGLERGRAEMLLLIETLGGAPLAEEVADQPLEELRSTILRLATSRET